MVKVDESNVSVCWCPITESVANVSESGGKRDQTSMGESRHRVGPMRNTNSLNDVKMYGRW